MNGKLSTKRCGLTLAAALVLGALVLAGCGGSSSGSSTTAIAGSSGSSAAGSGSSAAGEGARGNFEISDEAKACLKEKGVELPGFKGGEGRPPRGGEGGEPPEGFEPPAGAGGPGGEGSTKMKQAFEECGIEMPAFKGGPGGRGGAPVESAAFRKQVKEYVACVRRNGYELAEPNFSGEGPVFEESEAESAAFKKASAKCRSLLGGPGAGQEGTSGETAAG